MVLILVGVACEGGVSCVEFFAESTLLQLPDSLDLEIPLLIEFGLDDDAVEIACAEVQVLLVATEPLNSSLETFREGGFQLTASVSVSTKVESFCNT